MIRVLNPADGSIAGEAPLMDAAEVMPGLRSTAHAMLFPIGRGG